MTLSEMARESLERRFSMYIEELLEVAIGLVLVWFVLALACMQVQEVIASVFKLRARDLEKAIRGMLEEPERAHVFKRLAEWVKHILKKSEGAKKSELVDRLYNHQLIRALTKPGKKPSYIPDRTFALALFDVVMTAGTDASTIKKALETLKEKEGELPQLADQAVKAVLDGLITMAQEAARDEMRLGGLKEKLDSFTKEHPQLKPVLDALLQVPLDNDSVKALEQIVRSAAKLAVSNPQAAQALNALIAGAEAYAKQGEKPLAAARTNVETWFNDTMDRLTGWYKRRAQVITIILGLVFAILLNVDTVVIATTLWREPLIRDALTAQADKLESPFETEAAESEEAWRNFGRGMAQLLRASRGSRPSNRLDAGRIGSRKQAAVHVEPMGLGR
jgi:hypothetical protein